MESVYRQLVVIGNGFDLHCGLHSSYLDFKRNRKLFFAQPDGVEATNAPIHHETIWDIILDGNHGSDWKDIEGCIASWIDPDKTETNKRRRGIEGVLFCLVQNDPKAWSHDLSDGQRQALLYLLEHFPKTDWNCHSLYRLLMEELNVLENDFKNYLDYEVNASAEYKDKARHLLFSILADGGPDQNVVLYNINVLCFNYTRSAEVYSVGYGTERAPIRYCNIHGRLTGSIIFGIDGSGRLDNADISQFTKTSRVMSLRSQNGNNGRSDNGVQISKDTDVIKFFGHSLGDADYSYFQSIFDMVNLYGGKTKLVFYYCPYQLSDGTQVSADSAREQQMAKALKLLNSYGSSLDNPNHGRNLVHKMLLENRIEICELKEMDWKELSEIQQSLTMSE